MKNFIIGMVLIVGLLIAGASVSASVGAPDCSGIPTVVDGVVYSGSNINTPPVPNVQVAVTCNGVTLTPTTEDPSGYYMAEFSANDNCNLGMQVTSCVGNVCNNGIIQDCLDNPLNLLGVDIFNVPEFGLIAGGVAMAGALAGFVFLRKRK